MHSIGVVIRLSLSGWAMCGFISSVALACFRCCVWLCLIHLSPLSYIICVASARWPRAWVWVVWRFAWYPLQARLSCRRLGRVLASVAWCLLSWSLRAVGAVFREVAAVALRAFVLSSFSGVAVATCCQRRLGIAGCRCVLCERVVQLANARRSAALCSQRGPRLRSHSKARILRDG